MVILGLTGVVLFAVSVAALTLPEDLEKSFFQSTWEGLSNHDKQVGLMLIGSVRSSLVKERILVRVLCPLPRLLEGANPR